MSSDTRDDIRSLLKTFGIQADEEIIRYLESHQGDDPVHFRITLTTVGEDEDLNFEVEGLVRR